MDAVPHVLYVLGHFWMFAVKIKVIIVLVLFKVNHALVHI